MRSSCHNPVLPFCTQNVSPQKNMAYIRLSFLSMTPKQMTVCYCWEIIKSGENLDRISLLEHSLGKSDVATLVLQRSLTIWTKSTSCRKQNIENMEKEKLVKPYKPKLVTDWKEAVYKEVHHKTAVQLLLFLEWKMGRQISKLVTQNVEEKRMPLKYP